MRKLLISFVLFCLILAFFGCSSNKVSKEEKKEISKTTIYKPENVKVPKWIFEKLEEGDFVIGISPKSFDYDKMVDASKGMAAVIKGRNTGSYSISKYASQNAGEDDAYAEFELNVSSSIEEVKRIYNSLNLIDETYLYGFFIGLYSMKECEIEKAFVNISELTEPEWISEEEMIVTDEVILSKAFATSINLDIAWEKAAENARIEMGKFLEKDVQGLLKSTDEKIDKSVAVETTIKTCKMDITRSHIVANIKDGLFSYKVFIEMKMER
ncbi:MAG: hypothetical protein HQ534_00745 [Armatimonadetes bacterium]|nr:hypothetical protein [Armatimonadota bacterium]